MSKPIFFSSLFTRKRENKRQKETPEMNDRRKEEGKKDERKICVLKGTVSRDGFGF
jgi:hypothetical protein